MGIRVEWGNIEETILEWIFEHEWNWSDFKEADAYTRSLLDAAGEPVDIISDLTASPDIPQSILANMPPLRDLAVLCHPNARYKIYVSGPELVDRIIMQAHTEKAVNAARIAFAEDLDTAYDLVEGMRQTGR